MNLFKRSVLAATAILAMASYPVYAVINSTVAVCNPTATTQCLKPDTNGALPVTGTFSANTTALANTVAPTYTDGTTNPLSADLNGALRVTGSISANTTAQATTAAPSYVNGTPNPLSQDLSGNLRTTLTTALPAGANVIGSVTARNGGNITPIDGNTNTNTTVGIINSAGSGNIGIGNFPYEFNGTTWDRKRGDINGSWTQGNVASGATDAGNPVKVGGIYSTSNPSYTAGNRADFRVNTAGMLGTSIYATGFTPTDGQSNTNMNTPGTIGSTGISGTVQLPVYNNIFNGTSWDRQRGDATGGAWAQGNVASGATDAGNPVKVGGVFNTTVPTLTTGQRGDFQLGTRGSLNVQLLLPNSGNAATAGVPTDGQSNSFNAYGMIGLNSVFNGTTWDRMRGDANGGAWVQPSTNSGTSNFSAIMAATTNSTLVKNAPGVITEISVYNSSTTVAWLKLYNSASAPTCGTGTPVGRYLIPGGSNGGGSNVNVALGKAFSTGIAFCVTGLVADADTTATAASTMTVNMTYK